MRDKNELAADVTETAGKAAIVPHRPRSQETAPFDQFRAILSSVLRENVNTSYLEKAFEDHNRKVSDLESNKDELSKIFIAFLESALMIEDVEERVSQINIFCKVFPYLGPDLVVNLELLIPNLVASLVSNNSYLKRSTLNALHICMRYASNKVDILRSLLRNGVANADTKTRTEVMVSLPILLTPGIIKEDLFDIIYILVRQLSTASERASPSLPAMTCLERLKDLLYDEFHSYILRLPKQLQMSYEVAVGSNHRTTSGLSTQTSDLENGAMKNSKSKCTDVDCTATFDGYSSALPRTSDNCFCFAIVPPDVILGLNQSTNWRVREAAMEKLDTMILGLDEVSFILPYLDEFLKFLVSHLDDPNFRVQLRCLKAIADFVGIVGTHICPHAKVVANSTLSKLGDGKSVVKQAVSRVIIQLIPSVGPERCLEFIFPLLEHRSSRIRHDAVDLIIIALLTVSSSQLSLDAVSRFLAPLLLDSKRRVRHAVLECYSLIAQKLGQGRLNPIVTAVDGVELQHGGDGVMEALQARLARRQLPKLNAEGMLEYAVKIPIGPTSESPLPRDVDWILKAHADGMPKTLIPDGTKRYFSAGRSRLPWELNEVSVETRKVVGSAPLRAKPLSSAEETREIPVREDTWLSSRCENSYLEKSNEGSYLGAYVSKGKMPGFTSEKPELSRSESQGSYFKLYKDKMKRLKEAGLQADPNIVASFPSYSTSQGYTVMYKKGMLSKISIVEDGQRSKLGTHTLSPLRPHSFSPDNVEDHQLLNSWSGSEGGNHVKDKGQRQDLKPIIGFPGSAPRIVDSPVCVKPQLARSASKKRHQSIYSKIPSEKTCQSLSDGDAKGSEQSQVNANSQLDRQVLPFDWKPRLARTPSGKLSSGKWKSLDRLGPLTTGENVPVPNFDCSQSAKSTFDVHSNERDKEKNGTNITDEFYYADPALVEREREASMLIEDEIDDIALRNNRSEETGSLADFKTDGDPIFRKSFSGLSKSALERAEKKRLKEKMKLQIEQQMKEEKNPLAEGKKKLSELEKQKEFEQKRQQVARSLAEIRKLENLLLSKRQTEPNDEDSPHLLRKHLNETVTSVKDDYVKNLGVEEKSLPAEHSKPGELGKLEKKVKRCSAESLLQDCEGEGCRNKRGFEQESEALVSGKRLPSTKGYELFDADVSDLKITGETSGVEKNGNVGTRQSSKNQGTGKPYANCSPRLKRKSTNSQSISITTSGLNPSIENDMVMEQSTILSNPDCSLREALKQLAANAEDWDLKCSGLHLIRCLATHHSEILTPNLHTTAIAVAAEVKNLRSQVARISLACLADMFRGLGRTMEPETEELTKILLSKTCDTNVFIREDAEKALTAMVQNVSPKHAMVALINGGGSHRNKDVRKVCARQLVQVAETIGYTRLLNGTKDITDRIIPTASQFALDGQPETRYCGRKMLFLMMEHQDFDKLLEKHLEAKNLRPIKDLVHSLRSKGLGEPPNLVGSAGLRKSLRHTDSATTGIRKISYSYDQRNNEIIGNARSGSGNAAALSHKSGRVKNRDDVVQGTVLMARNINLESLEKLDSNDWKERMEGIDAFTELTERNPDGIAASVVKVFDRFAPRLADSNGKVTVHAIQALARVTPCLGDTLVPVLGITIRHLQGSIASNNDVIYSGASGALSSIVQHVDSIALVPHLVSAVQFSNNRVKPELTAKLAEIVPNVYSKKPGLIGKCVLPLFWTLLNSANAGSAGPGRNDLTKATTSLANQLYLCHGESLVEEAESHGSRVKQRLHSILVYRT